MNNKEKKAHEHTEYVLGYSLPKFSEMEKDWKTYMKGGIWTNLMTNEVINYDDLKKTIPLYFHNKYEMYVNYVQVFGRKYNNLCDKSLVDWDL
jgi:hypothetical protein